ncbi:hypothetical protein VNI00_008413 [Paramarasmius palmivorus]|uniref:Uncharacterized protein n=1 Tax=Paramarasmius palmivorus TaxID=297713 RepID=A0AAW0CXE3_9AGAR
MAEPACPAVSLGSATPYRIAYSGIDGVDKALCTLVAVFHGALDNETGRKFLQYFLTQGGPVMAMVSLEGCRRNRHILFAFPIIYGILMQVVSFGATFSFYWAPFIASGAATVAGSKDTIVSKADAQAIVFGQLIGFGIPTVAMVTMTDPSVTALWQFVPVIASALASVHLLFRSRVKHSQSGWTDIRNMYIVMFILGAITHLVMVVPKVKGAGVEGLKNFFIPAPTDSSTGMEQLVLNLLQYDMLFGMGSSLLATFWFAHNTQQFRAIQMWIIAALPILGPGATFAAIALWRESRLHPTVTETEKAK